MKKYAITIVVESPVADALLKDFSGTSQSSKRAELARRVNGLVVDAAVMTQPAPASGAKTKPAAKSKRTTKESEE